VSALIDDDGGPAFPNNDQHGCAFAGMTLRDWFAGQALNGYLSTWENEMDSSFFDPHHVAKSVYAFADAMIAARKGGAE
jgi:hypothetical protein